jgi:hypothetical protein
MVATSGCVAIGGGRRKRVCTIFIAAPQQGQAMGDRFLSTAVTRGGRHLSKICSKVIRRLQLE